jgi:VWFA-related protein
MRARISLAITILSFPAIVAQTTPAPSDQLATIRTRSEEVLLDVVVRDKHHKLVTNLRPNEIEVHEDGVRQDVKIFQFVEGAAQLETERSQAQAQTTATPGPAQAAVTPVKQLRELNFVSIVFGPIAPLDSEFAREAVTDFLKSDSFPNTYLTVYTLANNHLSLAQPYTDNKNALTAVIDRISKGASGSGASSESTQIASTAITSTLANSAAASSSTQPTSGPQDPMLGQFSGAIVTSPLWARNSAATDASTNLGAALETQAMLATTLRFDASEGLNTIDALRALVYSQARLPGRKLVLYLSDGLAFPVGRREIVDNLISLANRSGVTFYAVDTLGLSLEDATVPGLASQGMVGIESRQRGAVTTQNPVHGYQEMDDAELGAVSNREQNMQELAESTGGFAVVNTNQIAEPMERVMEDIRTHYELSYVPKSTTYDGHFRKIEVKLSRPNLTVQTRKGYYALPMLNGEPLQPFEAKALDEINTRPFPSGLPFDAGLMKFWSNQNLVQYMIGLEIPVAELRTAPLPKSDKSQVRASFVALVRDAQGEVVGKISREFQRQISPQDAAKVAMDHISYMEPLALPRGDYAVEIAVSDEFSRKSSVRRIAFPRESRSGLDLSSLAIVEKAEPLVGPANPLNPFDLDNTRIVPELGDTVPSGPVVLYFVLYPAKLEKPAPPQATLEILRDGSLINRQALKLPEARADGSVPVVLRVSPGPGSYAIVVTARQGNLVAQSYRALQIQ